MALFSFLVTAVVNKALAPSGNFYRIGGLLAANGMLWLAANWAMSRFLKRIPRPVVSGPRPVAIGEKKQAPKEEAAS
jgi:hypothetical protein